MRGITVFGVCAKPNTKNPIGYFGTGLKYAIAVLLRAGCIVELNRGDENFVFTVNIEDFRGEGINRVFMNGEPLPFTTELGRNWAPWMAYRELACNAYDENGGVGLVEREDYKDWTGWVIEGDVIEAAYKQHDKIFLSSEPLHKLKDLELHDNIDGGEYIYHKGIRVYKLSKPSLYVYNLTGKLELTEDRTATNMSMIHLRIAQGIAKSESPSLIRQVLLANERFFESTIDYHWWSVEPGEVFNKVIVRLIGMNTSFNSSAKSVYRRDNPKDEPPATIQIERIPMEQRRKLWAALVFWDNLGITIPKSIVHVTTKINQQKVKVVGGHMYISKFVLEMDMRFITGLMYKAYADTKPTIGGVKQDELLLDTLVDFGEQILGVSRKEEVA